MNGPGMPVASGTQRGKHTRAQAQAHDKQEERKRDKARGTALASVEFGEARSFLETNLTAFGRRK